MVVDIEKEKEDKFARGDMPKFLHTYPQRLMKNKEDNKFKKFMD